MKRFINILALPILLTIFSAGLTTQAYCRDTDRVLKESLSKLPAQNTREYESLMADLAATGAEGMEKLCGMLAEDDNTDNSKTEYAINGVVNYVSAPGMETHRKGVHDVLVAAVTSCRDTDNRVFLLNQLSKISDISDFALYSSLLKDREVGHAAMEGLASMPDADGKIVEMIKKSAPDALLCRLAGLRGLKGVEKQLIRWSASKDEAIRSAALWALPSCGTAASIKTLSASGDTDSYLRLLDNLCPNKKVESEAVKLTASDNPALRCAGLRLLLKSNPAKAKKNVLTAIADKCPQYRHTVLLNARQYAGEGIAEDIAAVYDRLPAASKQDVLAWFGDNHSQAGLDIACGVAEGSDDALAIEGIESVSKIGGTKAFKTLLSLLAREDRRDAAARALLSLKGDITEGVMASLTSRDKDVVKKGLQLASERRIREAYPKAFELARKGDKDVSEAAYAVLKNLVTPAEFHEICSMFPSSGTQLGNLQQAAKSAISTLPAEKQYELILGETGKSGDDSIFYPLLAQAGTAKAMEAIVKGLDGNGREAALASLLEVDNREAIDVLWGIATKADAATKDRVLDRYAALTEKKVSEPEEICRLTGAALALNPGNGTSCRLLRTLSLSPTEGAARLAADYLENPNTDFDAASALLEILSKNPSLRQGEERKSALVSSISAFRKKKEQGDADAGYAIDKANGFLQKWK